MADTSTLDRFQGCLLGGAAGDALGYPVEFDSYESICDKFGPAGIRAYDVHPWAGVALFSDDTQMTLFSAEGLLHAGPKASDDEATHAVYQAYLDWLHPQDSSFDGNPGIASLLAEQQLYARRAPGGTCLSALYSGDMGLMEHPLNDSKGCGGVMRVAPMGLFYADPQRAAHVAAMAAAITHGHPMGYVPAAGLAYIVNQCAYGCPQSLADVVEDCATQLDAWFSSKRWYAQDMASQLRHAAELSQNDASDHDNIVRLGEGWVGDEALAIAVYACLRHPDSFDEALIAAVNHGGDADSTGAIAGNIMGARLGIGAMAEKWTERLELRDLIVDVADRLYDAGHIDS